MDSEKDFLARFNSHFVEIDKELEKGFDSSVPLVVDIGKHSLLGNGKRLRPLLFVLSSRLCGYESQDIRRKTDLTSKGKKIFDLHYSISPA